jgi:serine/threonine-protein kinase
MRELARVPPLDVLLAPGPARLAPTFSLEAMHGTDATRARRAIQAGSILGQRYELRDLLGRGGMGAVYAACNLRTRREVAIKVLECEGTGARQREVVIRFLREARAAARIQHPNVVDLYDVDCDEGVFYMVMERLYGESLRTRLARGALEPRTAARIMLDAMRGVAEAHRCGVIHRDLKPDNVFLASLPGTLLPDPAAQVKVLDFGVSRIVENQEWDLHSSPLTGAGQVLGTPLYMPPEQLRCDPQLDTRADVYALGVTLYELLSGVRPYETNNQRDLLACQLERPIPSLRERIEGIDPALDAVVMCALHRQPEARYSSVESFATALSAWLDARVAAAEPPARALQPAPARVDASRGLRKRALLIGSLIAAALVIVLALQLLQQVLQQAGRLSASRHEQAQSEGDHDAPPTNARTMQEHPPVIPAELTDSAQAGAEPPSAAPAVTGKKKSRSRAALRTDRVPARGSPEQTQRRETLLLPGDF